MINWITQSLTTAPLWIQTPIVFVVVVPLCGLLALLLVRGTDLVAGQFAKWNDGRRLGDSSESN